MAANTPRGDDDLTDLPWASVFDPAANARALSAIQAEGFRAASDLVERFADIARHAATGERAAPVTNGAGRVPQGLSPDVDMVISTWWTVIGQMFRAMRGEAPRQGEDRVSVDVATDESTGCVHLVLGDPERAGAEVWLHNSGDDDAGEVVVRCGGLVAHDGGTIPSAAVRFSPAVVPLPGRSSRGVEVRAEPGEVGPGRYRGTIVVSGHPEVWLPVEVIVPAPTS